mgnify:FL=1
MLGKVEICGVNTSKLKVLKNSEMVELLKRIKQGDQKAREEMIEGNLRLVLSVIQRFSNRGENMDDLFQIGCIGLMKAIDNFDCTMDVKFSTYAVPMITGEIRRFLRDDGMVKVSRSLKENGYKISRAKEVLTTELGRDPSLLELSAMTELGTEEIVMALDANRGVESIYQPVCGSDGDELLLIDQIGDQSDVYEEPEKEAVLNKMVIRQLMDTLDETEQQIIRLRYFENKTQCEVAGILAVTQVQISRNERKILAKLRAKLEL